MTGGGAIPGAGAPGGGTRFTDVRRLAVVDSTNRLLLEEAAAGAREGLVLVADHQTAGRGRLGRTWSAPPGSSLLVSVLLRPRLPLDRVHLVTMSVALAAAEACEEVAGVTPRLKWPNDLVVPGGDGVDRKLAGILAESVVAGGELAALVVGMGMNVNWPSPLPPELAATATALDHEAGRTLDRDHLLDALLRHLEGWYGRLGSGSAATDVRDAWTARTATLGRRVRVDLGEEVVEGTATAVTADGHLVVEVDGPAGAERRLVAAGDVVHLRPAPG